MSFTGSADVPEDFDRFWIEAAKESYAQALNYRRSLNNDFDLPGFVVETLEFSGMNDRPLNGWIAYPEQARALPSFLWIPPYGRESMLPNAYGTRPGLVSMSFNFHGEKAFHQEKYVTGRGYFALGADSPETWIFRQMFQDAIIAMRVLQAQVEVDEQRMGAMGMSQGGGIAIWLGAWCGMVKTVCADMPFLAQIANTLQGKVYRYPLKEVVDFMEELPVGRERVLNTVSYYDTSIHASRCKVPTQVSLGLSDPAAKPDNVRAVYESLAGPKMLRSYAGGHEWIPDMIENNRQWLVENLR